jgi:hypothetical protein
VGELAALDLTGNDISDVGACVLGLHALAEALKKRGSLHRIQVLDLNFNGLGDEGAQALAAASKGGVARKSSHIWTSTAVT